MTSCTVEARKTAEGLARVLLVDDDPASRLALQTVLRAGGYKVETANSAAEAVSKMDEGEYELVLTDLRMESPEAGLRVLAHARIVEYRPAMAVIRTYVDHDQAPGNGADQPVLFSSDDIPELFSKVADLIGHRVTRRIARSLRQTG